MHYGHFRVLNTIQYFCLTTLHPGAHMSLLQCGRRTKGCANGLSKTFTQQNLYIIITKLLNSTLDL